MSKYGVNLDETIKRAIKAYDKEKEAEKRKGVLHNTRLLLRHYNDLTAHYEMAVDDSEKIKYSFDIDVRELDEVYIKSIMKSKIKTMIIIAHIDMALEQLRKKYVQSGTVEKYQAMEMVYLNNKSYEDVGEKLNCSTITARRWVNQAISDLSVFLFGIDGVKM